MKIIADQSKCCGHARCNAVAADVYLLDDNGYIAAAEIRIAPGMEAIARRGARACPERALTIIDDETASPSKD